MAKKRNSTLHRAYKLFPLLGDNELQELDDDINQNGLKDAILRLDGRVLGGQNRLAAGKLAGVEPRFVERKGSRIEHVFELLPDSVNVNGRPSTAEHDHLIVGSRSHPGGLATVLVSEAAFALPAHLAAPRWL